MELRDLLIKNISLMFPGPTFQLDFRNLVESIRPGKYDEIVPVHVGVTIPNIVNVVVDRALLDGWISEIVQQIPRNPQSRPELDFIVAQLKEQAPTSADPFEEVLLEGTRPFANRTDLRVSLRTLCRPMGSTLLVVTGEKQTGKSFSFYLAQHIARKHGFITSQFDVGTLSDPVALATEVLRRVGVPLRNETSGLESAQRTGKALADQVKDVLEERKQLRLLVFDRFPVDPDAPPLPAETISFIVRLATYADQELRPFLRILLIRFKEPLPGEIDDVAERDQAQAFTDADMFRVLRQVATARGWDVSDQALLDEIAQVSGKSMRERFQLMRKVIRRLSQTPPGGAP